MNTHELLEAAQLDALGLLDESERDSFEKAFASAHPAIKAQIRLEQARLCRLEGVWPDTRPHASLKDRVIDAVRAARGVKTEATTHVAGRIVPPITASHRVSPMWRAAALGFATAAAVCAAMLISLRSETTRLQAGLQADSIYGKITSTVGAANLHSIVFSPSTQRVVFQSPAERVAGRVYSGEAAVFFNADKASMQLLASNVAINDGESLRVCVVDANGAIVNEVQELPSAGPAVATEVKVSGRDLASKGLRLALVAAVRGQQAATGTVLLTTGTFNT